MNVLLKNTQPGDYLLATGLKGFRVHSLRVKAIRKIGEYWNVITADLLDVGTSLTLSDEQLVPFDEYTRPYENHKLGLVAFEG